MSLQDVRCALPAMYGVLGVAEVLFQAGKHDKPQVECLKYRWGNHPPPPPPPLEGLSGPSKEHFCHPKENKQRKLFLFVPEPPASPPDDCRNDSAARLDAVSTLSALANPPLTLWPNKQQSWTRAWTQSTAALSSVHYIKQMWCWARGGSRWWFFSPLWALGKMFDSYIDRNKMEVLSQS